MLLSVGHVSITPVLHVLYLNTSSAYFTAETSPGIYFSIIAPSACAALKRLRPLSKKLAQR